MGLEEEFENHINQMGREGWGLIGQYGTGLIFKRRIS
jgi:hypothetical protein